MKKAFLILSLLFVLASCKMPVYYIGMTETEFKSISKGVVYADLVEATVDRSIYKIDYTSVNSPTIVKLYYFENGKLVEIHEKEPRPANVIIQHTSN